MNTPQTSHSPFADAWYRRVRAGETVVQKCTHCHELQMYPRRHCVKCGDGNLDLAPVSGLGVLYSFTTIMRNAPSDFQDQLPYVLGIVHLAEGPRMLTRIVNCEHSALRCDMPVRWTLADIGGQQMPCFEPA